MRNVAKDFFLMRAEEQFKLKLWNYSVHDDISNLLLQNGIAVAVHLN